MRISGLEFRRVLFRSPRPRWGVAHAGVRRIMTLMVPTLFGASVVQVNLLLNTIVASFLIGGSVTWLYYTDRLLEFPLGMFGVAIARKRVGWGKSVSVRVDLVDSRIIKQKKNY